MNSTSPPPWPNQAPNGAPPPFGYGPPGSMPYPPMYPAPRSGARIVIAIFSLLFGLGCGCINLGTAIFPALLPRVSSLSREEGIKAAEHMLGEYERGSLQNATPAQRAERERFFRVLKDEGFAKPTYEALLAADKKGLLGRLTALGWLSEAASLLILVSAIMLFARARSARWFGIVASLLMIGVTVALALSWRDALSIASRELGPAMHAIIEKSGARPTGPGGQAVDIETLFTQTGDVMPVLLAGLASLYPFIAFLTLWLSQGIRRDLEGYPMPMPGYPGPMPGAR